MAVDYSVIIPVYNAEKTLRRCLDSLLCQSCEDVELLLVNDGSTDGSGVICEEYAARYPQIRYLPQENGGSSAARNAGMDAARGEYVLFVDSDDVVTPDYFSIVRNAAGSADLVQFGHALLNTDATALADNKLFDIEPMVTYALRDAICSKELNPPWAKRYRRSIIEAHSIRFPLGLAIGEDRLFNIEYAAYVQSYMKMHRTIYLVDVGDPESLSRRRIPDEQFVRYNEAEERLRQLNVPELRRRELVSAMNFGHFRGVYNLAKTLRRDGAPKKERLTRLKSACRAINAKQMHYPSTRYCKLVAFPVRHSMVRLLDFAAWKLNRAK